MNRAVGSTYVTVAEVIVCQLYGYGSWSISEVRLCVCLSRGALLRGRHLGGHFWRAIFGGPFSGGRFRRALFGGASSGGGVWRAVVGGPFVEDIVGRTVVRGGLVVRGLRRSGSTTRAACVS